MNKFFVFNLLKFILLITLEWVDILYIIKSLLSWKKKTLKTLLWDLIVAT